MRLLGNANLKLNSDSTWICILLVFLEVKSPQAHLPSASEFHVAGADLRGRVQGVRTPPPPMR